MARGSTLPAGVADDLRTVRWQTIHPGRGGLPWADMTLTSELVQYELLYHADELDE